MHKFILSNDETPSVRGKGFLKSTDTAESTPTDKRIANLIAGFALRGHAVHRLKSGFLVTCWGMSRHCPDYAALVNFGRVLGVRYDI